MSAAIPLLIFVADQAQPGFVDERGGLQRLARRLVGHLARRQATKLFIDERQQLIGGSGIALFSRLKDTRDVAHALQSNAGTTSDNSK